MNEQDLGRFGAPARRTIRANHRGRRTAVLALVVAVLGVVATCVVPAPVSAAGTAPAGVRSRTTSRLLRNRGDHLTARRRTLGQPDLDRPTVDRLRRYLDEAAAQGALLGADQVTAAQTDGGATLITSTASTTQDLTEQVVTSDAGEVVGYQFGVDTRTGPPDRMVSQAPGLGFATPFYSTPVASDPRAVGTLYTPGQGDAAGSNRATWHGDVYLVPDMDPNADFWSYHRNTKAYPNTSTIIDWSVTGVKAESRIADSHRPWFLGRGDYKPREPSGGGCRQMDMSLNVYGFGVAVPPVTVCGQLNPIDHDHDPWAFGSNWTSGVILNTDPAYAEASQMVKFSNGVWPVWDDYAFASFCQGSFVSGCDEAFKGMPDTNYVSYSGPMIVDRTGATATYASPVQNGDRITCPSGYVLLVGIGSNPDGSIAGPSDVGCVSDKINDPRLRCLAMGQPYCTDPFDTAVKETLFDIELALQVGALGQVARTVYSFYRISQVEGQVNRQPVDIDRQNNSPDPPAAQSSSSQANQRQSHTDYLNEGAKRLQQSGARDIRRDQEQVNAAGTRVGVNRPDLQFTGTNGQRYYVEIEGAANPRGDMHVQRIMANDPDGTVLVILLD